MKGTLQYKILETTPFGITATNFMWKFQHFLYQKLLLSGLICWRDVMQLPITVDFFQNFALSWNKKDLIWARAAYSKIQTLSVNENENSKLNSSDILSFAKYKREGIWTGSGTYLYRITSECIFLRYRPNIQLTFGKFINLPSHKPCFTCWWILLSKHHF